MDLGSHLTGGGSLHACFLYSCLRVFILFFFFGVDREVFAGVVFPSVLFQPLISGTPTVRSF